MQASVETIDIKGRHERQRRGAPLLASRYYQGNNKEARKHSQTFASSQGLDPSTRRYSLIETDTNQRQQQQQQRHQHQASRKIEHHRHQPSPSRNLSLDANRLGQLSSPEPIRTVRSLSRVAVTTHKAASEQATRHDRTSETRDGSDDVKSEATVKLQVGQALERLHDEQQQAALVQTDSRLHEWNVASVDRAEEVYRPVRESFQSPATLARPAAAEADQTLINLETSSLPTSLVEQATTGKTTITTSRGAVSGGGHRACTDHDLTDHQLANLTSTATTATTTTTCCSSRPTTGTSSMAAATTAATTAKALGCNELNDRATLGQCASLAGDALTVSVNEQLQMQDHHRKNVILSMALKQLIAEKQDAPLAPASGEPHEGGAFRSKSCCCNSTGPAEVGLTGSPSREQVKTTTTATTSTSGDEPIVPLTRDHQRDEADKRVQISERLAEEENASILFLNPSADDSKPPATTTTHLNLNHLIKQGQDQDGPSIASDGVSGHLEAARLCLANSSSKCSHEDQPTRGDLRREQQQRQLKARNSTGEEPGSLTTRQQSNHLMRQLRHNLVSTDSTTGQNQSQGRSSPNQLERPRSTILLECQLDKLGLKTDEGASLAATQTSLTPSRRSYSSFGGPQINCDTLSQSVAASQCDLNLEALIIESWLDDHPEFVQDYFIRKAPRQLIDDWLKANVRVSNSNLRGSQSDLCSSNSSISRPVSRLSLSGSSGAHLRAPAWMGSASMMAAAAAFNHEELDQNQANQGFVRVNRSNSQSAASALAGSRSVQGSATPIRKISATDFETRSGSGFLRPMLSKTPDGRFSFLPQPSSLGGSPRQEHLSPVAGRKLADTNQSSVPARSQAQASVSNSGGGNNKQLAGGGQPYCTELMSASSDSSNTSTIELNDAQCGNNSSNNSDRVEPRHNESHDEGDDDDDGSSNSSSGDEDHHRHHHHHHQDCTDHAEIDEAPDVGEVKMIFELVRNIYDDLDIRTLLHKILKNIAALINADRSSLFLVCGGPNDPNRRLVSQLFNVEQDSTEVGEADEPITIPWGTGLVGYVAESGEAVNIRDCYEDPRFTDAIDQRTGYVTRHMLCAPILDKRNEIVGVAQVINKRDGNAFSKNDEIKFRRYLQFCGIGLRNAQSYEQCQLENRRNQVLLDLARMVFEEQSTIEQVVHRIMLHTQSLLDCERCQVLLIDNVNDELESLLQMPNAHNLINSQSTNNNNDDEHDGASRTDSLANEPKPAEDKHPDWRPQCALKDDPEGQPSRPSSNRDETDVADAGDTDGDSNSHHPVSPLMPPQAPRLFSLVFDLECDGNDDPVVYDSRTDGAISPPAATSTTTTASSSTGQRRTRAFPINIGITGYVASTGETLNIENAHEHERFDASVDEGSDFKHRSILCMPIRNGQRQIIGVIQLINKKNGLPFNKNDEDLFEAFAIFCGLGIHNTLMYERVLKVMAKQRVTFEVLSYHATAPLEEAKKLSQEQVPSSFKLNLASLKFNDFSLDDQHMLKSCLRFFLDLDLMRRFQIDQLVFCNWILSVQKNYRKVTYHPIVGGNGLKASPVRYHNWRHAFNVGQMMFAILVNTQICQSLGELETLALLIACLCHDLDHRGTNNSFQIKSASPLAELYSTSTMEHHHFDQCVMILNSQGNQILANLSPQEYSRVIILLEEAILATDLANYFGKRDLFFQLTNSDSLDWRHNPNHRSLLRCMLMTACDVAAITKPWSVQKVVADLVMSEFYQQGDIERNELKIEPIDMMNRDKMSELPSMQIGFIDSICAPIYTAFAKLFPQQLHPLIDGCLANREVWRQLAESNTKPDMPIVTSGAETQ